MGRRHTFMDREFGRADFDPDDQGEFQKDLVFVVMPFRGQEMSDVYNAIKDECKKLKLNQWFPRLTTPSPPQAHRLPSSTVTVSWWVLAAA